MPILIVKYPNPFLNWNLLLKYPEALESGLVRGALATVHTSTRKMETKNLRFQAVKVELVRLQVKPLNLGRPVIA